MAEQFGNLAATTLSGAVDNAVTTLPVTSGAAPFPQSAQFRVIVDSEIMIVTAGAGSTSWTVSRGAESTTAAAHSSGAAVTHVLTAGALGVTSDPAAGTPGLRTLGTGSTQAAAGNDSRLSDSRTPTAHHTTHESGGTDAVTLAATQITGTALVASNNLSDVTAATARTNLGLGSLATKSAVASADITDGTIVDADISSSAAITFSKLAAPAADFSMNTHKITSLTNGSAASDAAAFGQIPTAASVGGFPQVIRRTGDSGTISSQAVLQNDDTLLFAVASSSAVYFVEAFVSFLAADSSGAAATADGKWGWSIPTGWTEKFGAIGNLSNSVGGWGWAPTANTPVALSTANGQAFGMANNVEVGIASAAIFVGDGAHTGNINFQWAQQTSNAATLKIMANSLIRITRLA